MSGQKPVSLLFGRPRTEWSTLPTLSRTDHRSVEKDGCSSGKYQCCYIVGVTCFSTVCEELSKLNLDMAVAGVQTAQARHCTASSCSAATDDRVLFGSKLSISKPHYHKHSRKKYEKSCGTQIPTALVTPLPGTSPPQQANEQPPDHLIHQHIKLEPNSGRKVVEQRVTEEPPTTTDNTVKLTEKWKGLIDMKDVILKQKNLQIER